MTFATRGSDALTFAVFLLVLLPATVVPGLGVLLGVAIDSLLVMVFCAVLAIVGIGLSVVMSGRIARRITAQRSPKIIVEATGITIPLPGGPKAFPLSALSMESGWYTPGASLESIGVSQRSDSEGLHLRLRCGTDTVFLDATDSVGDGVAAGFTKGFIQTKADTTVRMWGTDLIALFTALKQAGVAHNKAKS